MCGEHEILVLRLGVGAFDEPDDIVALEVLHRVREADVERDARIHRPEAARLGAATQRGEVEPGLPEERRRRVLRDPSAEAERLRKRRITREHALFLRPAADDRGPAIAGALGVVDDEHARRTATFRFLELVCPAAVVRHRLAAEQIGLGCRRRWIVHEHEQDLAAHVDVLEIIPAELRRGRAIADEHDRSLRAALRHRSARPDDDILRIAQVGGRLAARHGAHGAGGGCDHVDGHALKVRLLVPRLHAVGAERVGEVELRDRPAARGGCAAFEQVVGEEADVRLYLVDGDGRDRELLCGERRRGHAREQCRENAK